MTDDTTTYEAGPPLSLLMRLSELSDRFEEEWRADLFPRIEAYLREFSVEERPEVVRHLIALELDLRRVAGDDPDSEEYRKRFPDEVISGLVERNVVPPGKVTRAPINPTIVETLPEGPEDTHVVDHVRTGGTSTRPDGQGDSIPRDRAHDSAPRSIIPGYEVFRELGRGATGVVYLGRQIRLNRPCALKMIHAGDHAGAGASARFLAEAEIIAKLQHPNVVQIHALGDHHGRPYFELEFVEGGSLAKRLDGIPWEPLQAARLVETLARATGEAHRLGIVHRDLKPANVLLTADGTPKVADFGLAKSIGSDSSLTHPGTIMGTPSYMSPEQAEGKSKEVGPTADIYALGAILYELLTGRPPFRGTTVMATLDQVKSAEPVSPSRLVPGLPRDIETVALKCLQKDSSRRYESAAELAVDLRRFQDGKPVTARPVGNTERTWRWCRRNPLLAGSLGAAASALVAVAMLIVLFAVQQAKSLATSNTRLAALYYQRGQSALEKGQSTPGLFWIVESWRAAIAAGNRDQQHAARVNLAAWLSHDLGIKAVLAHRGFVRAVAFSPNAKTVVTGSYDNTARLWDMATGRPIGRPLTHKRWVLAVAFSPDGKTIITGSEDWTARLWNATTGDPIGPPLTHIGGVRAVAFSPDGKTVLTGSDDKTAQLWDATTGKRVGRPFVHNRYVLFVAFSPDGTVLLTGAEDTAARLWNATTGDPIGPPLEHGRLCAGRFSPDGKTILTGGGYYRDNPNQLKYDAARLWNATTGEPIKSFLWHNGAVMAVAFSPDGRTVVTGSGDGTARMWDTVTGKPIARPLKHQGQVLVVAFSPDGKTIVTGSNDRTARLWDTATGESIGVPLMHHGEVRAVAFSPDGSAILTGSDDGTARLWFAPTAKTVAPHLTDPGGVEAMAFSPDGKLLLTGSIDRTARMWELATGKPVGSPLAHETPVRAVAFSADGKTVITGGDDRTARLWDVATGKPMGTPLSHRSPVRALSFSPDGKTILTASKDTLWQLWNAFDGELLAGPRGTGVVVGDIRSVAISFDTSIVFTGGDHGDAQYWDLVTGKSVRNAWNFDAGLRAFSTDGKTEVECSTHGEMVVRNLAPYRLLKLQTQYCSAVVVSPDGKSFLSVHVDGKVRLWDATTGSQICQPLAHEGKVLAVAFSSDGKTAVTGCDDGTARLWDLATGKMIGQPLEHRGKILAVALSADGKAALTGGDNKLACLWDLATGKLIGQPFPHEGNVLAVAFSPDGKAALTGSDDKMARLWDLATGQLIGQPLAHEGKVLAVAFSPDGRIVLTVGPVVNGRNTGRLPDISGYTGRLWNISTSKPVGPPLLYYGEGPGLAFSPEGKRVRWSGRHTMALWDTATGKPIGPPGGGAGSKGLSFLAVAISPDGKTVLTGHDDNTARLWDSSGEPLGPPLVHPGKVLAVALSPGGNAALTSCDDKVVRLWDIASGKLVMPPMSHKGVVHAMAFSPDGKTLATGSSSDAARVWDVASGQLIGTAASQHGAQFRSVDFSPDGTALRIRYDENTVKLWDTATGKPIVVGKDAGLEQLWRSYTIQPAGASLPLKLSVQIDEGTARLRDIAIDAIVGPPLAFEGRAMIAALSPDGRLIFTGNTNGEARLGKIAELPDDVSRVSTWIELVTDLELDERGRVRNLDTTSWLQLRERLLVDAGPSEAGARH